MPGHARFMPKWRWNMFPGSNPIIPPGEERNPFSNRILINVQLEPVGFTSPIVPSKPIKEGQSEDGQERSDGDEATIGKNPACNDAFEDAEIESDNEDTIINQGNNEAESEAESDATIQDLTGNEANSESSEHEIAEEQELKVSDSETDNDSIVEEWDSIVATVGSDQRNLEDSDDDLDSEVETAKPNKEINNAEQAWKLELDIDEENSREVDSSTGGTDGSSSIEDSDDSISYYGDTEPIISSSSENEGKTSTKNGLEKNSGDSLGTLDISETVKAEAVAGSSKNPFKGKSKLAPYSLKEMIGFSIESMENKFRVEDDLLKELTERNQKEAFLNILSISTNFLLFDRLRKEFPSSSTGSDKDNAAGTHRSSKKGDRQSGKVAAASQRDPTESICPSKCRRRFHNDRIYWRKLKREQRKAGSSKISQSKP